ncbi:MAG: hypothetical protein JNK87_41755 [Bryobacterales bacterium]|nr:hypothetical protein [Bryobacterales bacterium]
MDPLSFAWFLAIPKLTLVMLFAQSLIGVVALGWMAYSTYKHRWAGRFEPLLAVLSAGLALFQMLVSTWHPLTPVRLRVIDGETQRPVPAWEYRVHQGTDRAAPVIFDHDASQADRTCGCTYYRIFEENRIHGLRIASERYAVEDIPIGGADILTVVLRPIPRPSAASAQISSSGN